MPQPQKSQQYQECEHAFPPGGFSETAAPAILAEYEKHFGLGTAKTLRHRQNLLPMRHAAQIVVDLPVSGHRRRSLRQEPTATTW
jgi:hypothetical protein